MPAPQDNDAERAAREASEWFVRLSNPMASDHDRRRFQAWLAADPAHGDAIQQTRALWSRLGEPAAELGRGGWHRHAPRRPAAHRTYRLAASICAIAFIGGALFWRDPGLVDRWRADHATRAGEHLEIVLADDSRLYLDGDSAVTVQLHDDRREVEILRGRVWFDVARDEKRPFRVVSNEIATEVLGTAFGIDNEHAKVTVEHGRVAVSDRRSSRVELGASEQIAVEGDHLGAKAKIDPQAAFAWKRGLIVLDSAPLGVVADELGRMAPGRVIIADAELRALTLSGVFRADDPDAVIEAMHTALGLQTLSLPGFATLVYR